MDFQFQSFLRTRNNVHEAPTLAQVRQASRQSPHFGISRHACLSHRITFFLASFFSALLFVFCVGLTARAPFCCACLAEVSVDREVCRLVRFLFPCLATRQLCSLRFGTMKPQQSPETSIWPRIGTQSGGGIRSASSHVSSMELISAFPRSRKAEELKSPAIMSTFNGTSGGCQAGNVTAWRVWSS